MIFSSTHRAVLGIIAAALLGGCASSGTSTVARPMHQGPAMMGGVLRSPSGESGLTYKNHKVVYVGNIDGKPGLGNVLVFPASLKAQNPNPNRMIQNGTVRPWGICTDSTGNLYVANLPQGAPSIGITAFHPHASSPFKTLTDKIFYPTEVACGKDGTIYVNQRQDGNGNLGDFVSVYPHGDNHATQFISMNFTGYDVFSNQMAFDTNGDLLVSASAFLHGGLTLKIFRMNTKTFKVSPVDLNLGSLDGPGLAVDSAGNIYVSGQYTGQIDVFAPGSKDPSRVIDQGAADMTIMPDGTLYASISDGVDEYAPGGSYPVNTIHAQAQGVGVAVGPAL